ncbi:hypothetical protein [Aminobacter anthyllidis]|uniref:hypothetical protein n=1 Tax=Aminobacter anthyllidis TaxID=1035067 RepID=UPI001FEAF290|nr:hypothetical protein [Aminobacter anthyllidis]
MTPRFIENVAAPAEQTDKASASNAMSEVLIIATIATIPFAQENWCPKAWEKESPKAEHDEKPGRQATKGRSK